MTIGRVAKWVGIAGLALIALLAVVLLLLDWNQLRPLINNQVSDELGRPFAIRGDLDVKLGLPLRVVADDVVVGNAPWGSRETMLQVDRLDFRVRIWPLLTGRLVIPAVTLVGGDLLLEHGPKDRVNWVFGQEREGSGAAPVVGGLRIEDGIVTYRDPDNDTDLNVKVETRRPDDAGETQLVATGRGKYQGQRFALKGNATSPIGRPDPSQPYAVDLKASAGKTQGAARGTVIDPYTLAGLDVQLDLQGPDLQRLKTFFGLAMPPTPPYKLEGRLQREQAVWRFLEFEGAVGNSHLAGEFAVDLGGRRPAMRGDLVSRGLDMADLAGFLGDEPGAGFLAKARERGGLWSDEPLDLGVLRNVDADVRLRAERVKSGLAMEDFQAHLRLDDGTLTLDPLNFGVASGAIAGNVHIDTNRRPSDWAIDMTVRRVDLSQIIPDMKAVETDQARLGGRVKLAARGNSIADMMSNADGSVGLAITQAELQELLVRLAGLDIIGTITSFFGDEETVTMRCAIASFDVKDGNMQVESLVVNTEESNFFGSGNIALGEEQLNLQVRAEPKDPTLSLRAPLTLTGSLLDPDIGVEGEALARGAGALGLGAVLAPVAGLLPLVDPGPGKELDNGCAQLFARAKAEGEKQEGR